ncbi:MAG: NTP transferase domain-containing protein [Kofleriaceae bacterium]
MKAVILAAGCSSRLRPRTTDTPKTLVPVGGIPILRRTLSSLMRTGFDQIVIVTGYLEHMIRKAVVDWFPTLDVTFVNNPEFRTTDNACSLLLAGEHVAGDPFMLLDGDVVFELGVIEELVERGPDCLAVRSVGDLGGEEVKVTADNEDRVRAISKREPVCTAMGESVGIALFSATTSTRLFAALHDRVRVRGLVNEYYEAAFQQVLDEGLTLYGVDITLLYATEIDTLEDLSTADEQLARRRAFDTHVEGVRLAG